MHIQQLPIALVAGHRRRDHDQLVFGDEIPYAPLSARALVAGMRQDVELEARDEREQEGEKELHGERHRGR
ncbi:hypothetical protein Tdes44962_MAKER08695 [Teratosphaeria destructans]|uniref:Uncharacterized protein n=1 Tax=Teratosphaeria destructans TaxID=418781 RepID=A0A9W7SVR2_9PEZI|nr:hypothetical protein Tdes44962_MAKER08695 [Teratosphaeria destructans]